MTSKKSDPAAKDGAGDFQRHTDDPAHNASSSKSPASSEVKVPIEGPVHLIAGHDGIPEIRIVVENGYAKVRVARPPWSFSGLDRDFILPPSGRPGRMCRGWAELISRQMSAAARKAEASKAVVQAARARNRSRSK